MLHLNKDIKVNPVTFKFDYDKEYFPKPGMLGTLYVGSDRYVVICLSNETPTRITVTDFPGESMEEILNNNHVTIDDGAMVYNDIDNFKKDVHEDDIEMWSLRKNGKWKKMNSTFSAVIDWGIANPYRDLDF